MDKLPVELLEKIIGHFDTTTKEEMCNLSRLKRVSKLFNALAERQWELSEADRMWELGQWSIAIKAARKNFRAALPFSDEKCEWARVMILCQDQVHFLRIFERHSI